MSSEPASRTRRRRDGARGSRPFGERSPEHDARLADREIRLGIWKIHILHHAASRDVWGLWLLDELAEHGHRLSPGTLYPVLSRMERNGWLRRTGAPSHSRARQTLRITAEGRRLLRALQRDVTELYEEVVLGREPEHDGGSRRAPRRRAGPRRRRETMPPTAVRRGGAMPRGRAGRARAMRGWRP